MRQTATYWEPSDLTNDGYGERTWSAPITIPCRWEDKSELFVSREGEELRSNAKVYLARALVEGGFLYLGESTNANPKNVEGAYRIRKAEAVPDLQGRRTLHCVML